MNDKIKILHVLPSLEMGGMENGVVNLANGINQNRFTIQICCLNRLGSLTERLHPDITVINMEQGAGKAMLLTVKLAKYLFKYKFDIVHTHNDYAGIYGILAGKLSRTPINIHGEHGLSICTNGYRRKLKQLICGLSDKVTTVSDGLKKDVMNYWKVTENKIVVLKNGVDRKKFYRNEKIQVNQLGIMINKHDIIIGAVGRLADQKNYPLLLNALKIIDDPRVKILFVGDGPLRKDLEDLSKKSKLQNSVFFLGERQDVPEIYNILDIFILTSYKGEGIANCMLEAMATGLPIIASDIEGNIEVVVDKENGFLFKSQDVNSLCEKITILIKNEELRRKMGQTSLKMIEDKFTMEKMVSNYENFYQTMYLERIN